MLKEKINLGIIGLGERGIVLTDGVLLGQEDIRITAVCDLYKDRQLAIAEKVKSKSGFLPVCTDDYNDVLKMESVDAVIISTGWSHHVQIACDAMKAGKAVGCEVGGAAAIEDCWKLVRVYEETGTPIMMLENCCYGREELMLSNMVRQGVFGEVVYCAGGYHHDLRDSLAMGRENRHYRLDEYLYRNRENYPTHALGPIAKLLNINRGNRMMSVASAATKSAGLREYIVKNKGEDCPLGKARIAQGDIVTTTISCAGGENIVLTLNTTLPCPYSRGLQVRGTKGAYNEDNMSVFLDGEHNASHFEWKNHWGNIEKYREKYDHPIWKNMHDNGMRGVHNDIDYLVLRAFIDGIRENRMMPVDVYDMAAWMSISALSEKSLLLGGSPVPAEDFTCGRWMNPKPAERWQYGLDI